MLRRGAPALLTLAAVVISTAADVAETPDAAAPRLLFGGLPATPVTHGAFRGPGPALPSVAEAQPLFVDASGSTPLHAPGASPGPPQSVLPAELQQLHPGVGVALAALLAAAASSVAWVRGLWPASASPREMELTEALTSAPRTSWFPQRDLAMQPAVFRVEPKTMSFVPSADKVDGSLIDLRPFATDRVKQTAVFMVNPATPPQNVLIVNTNGGGHAVIGFHLAKQLRAAGHAVTVLVPGEASSEKMRKEPFSRFRELQDAGVTTVWGSPSDCAAALGPARAGRFDVVVDNNGKDMEACQPVVDWAVSNGAKQFLYVSSAGVYKPSTTPPHVEGDPVKTSAGHIKVEDYLAAAPVAQSVFRPQYITGDANNKDCEEWFFDRIARNRPVPIPGDGMAITNVAQVEDMARMMTMAVGNAAAHGGLFNCVGDKGVTLDGLVRLCAEAAGKNPDDVPIVHYDPDEVGVEGKKAFPFRYTYHFFAEPRAALTKLGMTYERPLLDALKERWAAYVASGRGAKDMAFDLDDQILASSWSMEGAETRPMEPAVFVVDTRDPATAISAAAVRAPARVVPETLPKIYVYDHCPFCVRVRLALGLKNIKHEVIFMANDDVATPTRLLGKKIAPIYEQTDAGFIMGESLDIIAKFDSDEQYGPTGFIKPASGRDDIKAWQKKTKDLLRLLHRPRYMMAALPEFQQRESRDYFVFGHPVPPYEKSEWKGELTPDQQWAQYSAAMEQTPQLLPELNAALQDLEMLIHSDKCCTEGGLSYDDIDLWARLRSITLVAGAQFGPKTRAYLDTMAEAGDIPLYFGMAC